MAPPRKQTPAAVAASQTSSASSWNTPAFWVAFGSTLVALITLGVTIHWHDKEKQDQTDKILMKAAVEDVLNQDGYSTKLDQLIHKTDEMSGAWKQLKDDLGPFLQKKFSAAAKLDSPALERQLPAVRSLLAAAKAAEVAIPSDFWPAAARLISYRSVGHASSGSNSSALPDCLDTKLTLPVVTKVGPHGELREFKPYTFRHCKFTLDSPKDDQRFNNLIAHGNGNAGVIPVIGFEDCLIVYSGGSHTINIRTKGLFPVQSVTGHGHGATWLYDGPTMMFERCIFQFSSPAQNSLNNSDLLEAFLKDDFDLHPVTTQPVG